MMRHNDNRNNQLIAMLLACVTTTSAFGDGGLPPAPSPEYMLMNEELSWTDAVRACYDAMPSMHLASVYTAEQNEQLAFVAAGKKAWIGGTNAFSGGKWVWSPSGTKVSYRNWADGQPNNSGGNQHCMGINHIEKDKWDDDDCNKKRYFVCQKDPPPPVYTLMHELLSWKEANTACLAAGMELASVYSAEANEKLAAESDGITVWIGGTDALSENDWQWSGHLGYTPVTYKNWADGQPNNHGGDQACMQLNHIEKDQWDDQDCTVQQRFVCQSIEGFPKSNLALV